MPVPYWTGHYIGLPFADQGRDPETGLDCWGLVRLVLAERFGIALPSYIAHYAHTRDRNRLSALISDESKKWRQIASGSEDTGDVIILRIGGLPMHVGLVIGDRQMLHIEEKIDSAIESYSGARWKERVVAFFRHQEIQAS